MNKRKIRRLKYKYRESIHFTFYLIGSLIVIGFLISRDSAYAL